MKHVFQSAALALTLSVGFVHTASAGFVEFIIRGTPVIQAAPAAYGAGATEFILSAGGQKAALGSSDIDGRTLGSLGSVSIDRLDDTTRFAAGSGPAVAPYLNFWITDGAGRYALVANEPSNPDFQPLFNNGYNLSFADLAGKVAKIYETSDKSWLPNNGADLTFADLADYVIQAPTVAELTASWGGLGSGAARELNTNMAYGVNWVFGDTLSNYVSGQEGYVVANASVTAVPEPGSIALLSFGLLGLGFARRRRS